MRVLVVSGTKHGSTGEIATEIGAVLGERGLDVTVANTEEADLDVAAFDAVVLGSAVYVGHWTKDARAFADRNAERLGQVPLWLFSSGPLGDPPKPDEEPIDGPALATSLGARDHRTFTGRLDKDDLGLAERAAVRMVKAPYGDFRDWDDVRAWAADIADDLT